MNLMTLKIVKLVPMFYYAAWIVTLQNISLKLPSYVLFSNFLSISATNRKFGLDYIELAT